MVNPKNRLLTEKKRRNARCVHLAFIKDNRFECFLAKYPGLFSQVKLDLGKLRSRKYSKIHNYYSQNQSESRENGYQIYDFKQYLKKEKKIIENTQNLDKKAATAAEGLTLQDLEDFRNSYIYKSETGQELQNGNIDEQAKFLYYSTLLFYYKFNIKLK